MSTDFDESFSDPVWVSLLSESLSRWSVVSVQFVGGGEEEIADKVSNGVNGFITLQSEDTERPHARGRININIR